MDLNHGYACHMLMAYLIYLTFMLNVGWYKLILY
jgi:hypothetical protein